MNKLRVIASVVVVVAVVSVLAVFVADGTSATSTPIAAAQPQMPSATPTPNTIGERRKRRAVQSENAAALRMQGRAATPEQKRLFKVFRDPASPTSQTLRNGADLFAVPVVAGPQPAVAGPSELRTVFESSTITTGMFSTNQGLCFVGIVSGISSSLCTTTAAASKGGLGLLMHRGQEYDVMGVLPEGAKRAAVEEANGARIETPLDGADGYAFTIESEPNNLVVTDENGSVYEVGLAGAESRRSISPTNPAG